MAYPPRGYYMNNTPVDVIHMHQLNVLPPAQSTALLNNVVLPLFPSETSVTVAAGQAVRALTLPVEK